MTENDRPEFVRMLTATGSTYGREVSAAVLGMYWQGLERYSLDALRRVLTAHLRASKFFPSISELVTMIEAHDPSLRRPGPEEAWAMVPKNEQASALMTAEMDEAWRVAGPLIASEGPIPARMAFVEVYKRACDQAAVEGTPVSWRVSPGWDKDLLAETLAAAVARKLLTNGQATLALPDWSDRTDPSKQRPEMGPAVRGALRTAREIIGPLTAEGLPPRVSTLDLADPNSGCTCPRVTGGAPVAGTCPACAKIARGQAVLAGLKTAMRQRVEGAGA